MRAASHPNHGAGEPELDAALLDQLVAEAWPDGELRAARVHERARCGDGRASTADRIGLALDYRGGTCEDAQHPPRAILKTILLDPRLRFGLPVILGLARGLAAAERLPLIGRAARPLTFASINLYQRVFPHAPEAMYQNEVGFYRDIRPGLALEAPRVFATAYDPGARRFGILMEDLRLRGARFPNATQSASLDQVRALLRGLASLHARYWDSPALHAELAWVPTTRSGGMFPVFDAIGLDIIHDQLRHTKFKRDLIAPLGRCIDELWELTWRGQARLAQGPQTLCHGDAHIGNTYTLPAAAGGSAAAPLGAGFLDFQLMVRGSWAHDLGYLLLSALEPGLRRQHERDLVNEYFAELERAGLAADALPDPAQRWLSYRQSAIWGLVIGWLITPPVNYGEAITRANIQRAVTAMRDLDTLGAIEKAIP